MTLTWRGRHTATHRSAKAAGRWTATASGSPATGPATWRDANTTSGRLPRPPHRPDMRSPSHACFTCPRLHSALYVVDLKKFRKIAAGDRLRGQYQGLSQDPNSLSNLDQVCLRLTRPINKIIINKKHLLVSGSAQQHDPSGPHQVSASGVALV